MKNLLAAAAFALIASSAHAQETLKWAWEDANNDNVWNYSVVNWNFQSANQWNNFAVSRDAYQGATSLAFSYLNQDLNENGSHVQAFGYALIPTSYAANGTEPNSMDEYNAGRDLSSYSSLEFYIKGSDGANRSDLNVWLRSPNGFGSVQVPLKNYVSVNRNWQKVSIPLNAFKFPAGNPNGFSINSIHAAGFYVNQNNANVPFEFKVDNLSFVKSGGNPPAPATRLWWTEDADRNGEYNYSNTAYSGGAAVNIVNQWGDVAITDYMSGPMGNSPIQSVDLRFHSNAGGTAEAALTTSRANNGHEPVDFADKDAGKAISVATKLKFASPGTEKGVYVKLVDAQGRSSKGVSINDYRGSYGRYTFDFAVPVSAFIVPNFDVNNVKSVNFYVDRSTAVGDYNLHLTYLKFEK
ncbi:MAG: hypothetical protein EOP07_04250 [Proteobacteria bacterium]|nr:MAG: hypothetical protein EOP07_04250 [Pseudomonadota bacterium]